MNEEPFAPTESLVLTKLDQIKLLTHPLRVRILEALCRTELTTKQVAESLDEKPTRLYHHVEALERAGLVRLTRTRPVRGTVEKYYRAVAHTIRIDSRLFSSDSALAPDSPLAEMIATALDRTRDELRSLLSCEAGAELEKTGLLSFVEIEAPAPLLDELRQRLEALIRETAEKAESVEDEEPTRRFRLTLALYPLDRA